jgi:diaminopimelate epimerase
MSKGIAFHKMNGLGNEIVIVDLRGSTRQFKADEVRAIAARPASRFDQMMVLHDAADPVSEAFVRIYNSDGSEAEACGNGMRCVAWLLAAATGRKALKFETKAGMLGARVASIDRISVEMGRPRFDWRQIPLAEPFHDTRAIELQIGPIDRPILHSPSVVNVGNPHAVFWVEDVEAYDLGRIGPLLENHPIFPERANISLARVVARSAMTVRTWERGAGLTRACGSAACAATVCAARRGLTERRVTVTLPGGALEIDWAADGGMLLTGPVEEEHAGVLEALTIPATAT